MANEERRVARPAWMVLRGCEVWRRGVGGGRGACVGEIGARRDAVGALRSMVHLCGLVRGVRGDHCWSRAPRATSGRARRFLLRHRCASLGLRRRARVQPISRGSCTDAPGRRLPALPAQHFTTPPLHRVARR